MLGLKSEESTALWPTYSSTFTFYETLQNNTPNWTTFLKELFESMLSLEGDKMTAL